MGAFLESGAPTIEMFSDGTGGDRRGTAAQRQPGDGDGRDAKDDGGEGMEREHRPGDHTGGGGDKADLAEGAIPSPLPGE